MKTFLLSLILFCFCASLLAQHQLHKTLKLSSVIAATYSTIHFSTVAQEKAFNRYIKKSNQYKLVPADTLPRLLATRTDTLISGIEIDQDSFSFTYSGTRGGDENTQLDHFNFDSAHYFFSGNSLWMDSAYYINMFDTNNNILTQVWQTDSAGIFPDASKYFAVYDSYDHLDTVINYTRVAGTLVPSDAELTTYDSLGYCLLYIYQIDTGTGLINNNESIYTYDAHHNMTSRIDRLWVGGAWQNSFQYLYQYDTNSNQVIFDLYQWWSGAWQFDEHDSFTYNQQNKVLLEYDIEYNYQGFGLPEYDNTKTYQYDIATDTLVQSITDRDNYSGSWRNVYINYFNYDTAGRMLTYAVLSWDTLTSAYDSTYVNRFTYDAVGHVLTESVRGWPPYGSFSNVLITYTYDAVGNQITYQYEARDSMGNLTQDNYIYVNTYNSHGQYLTTQKFLWLGSSWVQTQNEYYWYGGTPSSILDIPATIRSSVYPDPFINTFTIAFEAETAGQAILDLYDINGCMLAYTIAIVSPGANTITWNIGHTLPTGLYIYELSLGNAVSRGKLVCK